MSAVAKRQVRRSDDVIAFLERYCRVPEGRDVGKPLVLRPWQKDIIRDVYDDDTRRAIISYGRKNGKSALTAMLVLVHLVGPAARQNSEIYSAALSRDQAAIIFRLAAKMIRQSPELNELITIRESRKELYYRGGGVMYQALSAEASKWYGLSPCLILHDELGQVRGPRHDMYEALETAVAAQESPLSVIISTQAPNDADLLSILIDDAKKGEDPRTKLFLWEADTEADPFAEDTIKQANPAYDDFQNSEEVLAMAEDARRMPARENQYRNLILNQRVSPIAHFVSPSVWDDNAGEPEGWGPCYGGLDLSESGDLTSLELVAPYQGTYGVRSTFWLPEEGLAERSRADRVAYDVWAEQGYIETTPGRSVEYEYVARYIVELFNRMDVRKIAFDRWNMKHLKPWLIKEGLSESFIEDRFVEFGQGFVSMSPALRNLESLLLSGKLRHGGNPVLRMCMLNAAVTRDPAGNRKLNKQKSRGRIDGSVSLAMAVSVAEEDQHHQRVYPVEEEHIIEDLNA